MLFADFGAVFAFGFAVFLAFGLAAFFGTGLDFVTVTEGGIEREAAEALKLMFLLTEAVMVGTKVDDP